MSNFCFLCSWKIVKELLALAGITRLRRWMHKWPDSLCVCRKLEVQIQEWKAELWPFHVSAGHTDSSLRRKVLLFLAWLRDSFLWVVPWEAGMERKTVCGCVCGIILWICVEGRVFFYGEFRAAINGVEAVWRSGGRTLGVGGGGGGGVIKLIWSWMPQRHGRCELATHPDRNLSRLHCCFVFQINWPLKITLRPSQHYWCTFSSLQLKVCTPHAALSPRSQRLLAPLVTENKLGLHIRAKKDRGGKWTIKGGRNNTVHQSECTDCR